MSSDQTSFSAVVPNLPQGATLHSLVTFLHRACGEGNGDRSCRRYFGLPKSRLEPGNPIGEGAQYLAEKFLKCSESGAELIRRHTVLGLYGLAMSPHWRGNHVLTEIANGGTHKKFSKLLPDPRPLAWCPTCYSEDLLRFGWAPWRVVHQVPFIHHCCIHETRLLTHCAACDVPLDRGFSWRLPGDVCRNCNGTEFRPALIVEQSPGYKRLLRVIAKLNCAMMFGESFPYRWDFPWKDLGVEFSRQWHAKRNQLAEMWDVKSVFYILNPLWRSDILRLNSCTVQAKSDSPQAILLLISLNDEFA